MSHIRRLQRRVIKLLTRPAPPTGPWPATASGQVAASTKASHSGVPPAVTNHSQHDQAANAILTVIPPRLPSQPRATPVI
jgi:hypothetical protein